MKKAVSTILAIVMLLTLSLPPVYATDADLMSGAQQVAENKLSAHGTFTFLSAEPLYNTELELEAACFSFSPCGYVIVNLNDYSVPEFSPSNGSPYESITDSAAQCVYVGPLNYYEYTAEDGFVNLTTGASVAADEFNYGYAVEPDASQRASALLPNIQTRGSTVQVFTNYLPVTWDSSYYCGLDGCAIILKYLDAHHESTLLSSSMDGNIVLQKYLLDNKYIPDTGTSSTQLVNGTGTYTGLNDFFSDRGSSFRASRSVYSASSSIAAIRASLSADVPVLIGTDPASDWDYGDHWVIIYGFDIDTEVYFVINDGFGNNGIHVTVEDDHYDDCVYFKK